MTVTDSHEVLFQRLKDRLILEAREFAKDVAPIYEKEEWVWAYPPGIPNAERIESVLLHLIQCLECPTPEFPTVDISTGRLQIIVSWYRGRDERDERMTGTMELVCCSTKILVKNPP